LAEPPLDKNIMLGMALIYIQTRAVDGTIRTTT